MAFPAKKMPADDADMDAVGALMAGDEGGDMPEKPAPGGDPTAVLDDIAGKLEELRSLVAG